MADEEKTEAPPEKTKKNVPGMVRSAKGVADHAAAMQEMQWDANRNAFRNPNMATLALFAYAKVLGALLHEAEERLKQEQERFAKRIAEFETRLTTMERWRAEAEAMTMEMVKGFEQAVADGPEALKEKILSAIDSHVPAPKLLLEEANGEKDGAA